MGRGNWGKLDRDWARNRKIRGLSMVGKVMWMGGFAESNRAEGDGVVERDVAEFAAHLMGIQDFDGATTELVEARLWHTPDLAKGCKVCKRELGKNPVPEDGWYIHAWQEYNRTVEQIRDPWEATKIKRKHELSNNGNLRKLILSRDGTLCRYCGKPTESGNNKPLSRTWDHVDPDGKNDIWNIVVACATCNGRKGRRFPWQAGMFLSPPPYPRGDGDRIIPDATHEGANPVLVCDPTTGLPWGQPRVNPADDPGATAGTTEGEPQDAPMVDLASRAHATPERVGSGSAPGRPQGQPEVNPGATQAASINPDGQQADVLQLPQGAL